MNLTRYINDHYGLCDLEKCICITQGWLGIHCNHWNPCGANNYEELAAWQKELKNASGSETK